MYYEGKMDLSALLEQLGDLEEVEKEYLSNALSDGTKRKSDARKCSLTYLY